ncbi:MAG: fluoride efflux transporter CrcB [Anaerolineae bacterium]
MANLLLVGIGGFIGAVMRYLTSDFVQRYSPANGFPIGTLAVNVLGCLIIGLLAGVADVREVFTPQTRTLVFVGVLGAFTTFSTFSYETASFLNNGQIAPALLNIGTQIALGLAAVWLGSHLAQLV